MLNAVKRTRKSSPAAADTAPPAPRKQDRLDLIEERVLRMRYGSVPAPDAPLARKTEDPVLLADLERLERALVQRLRGKPTAARPAATKRRSRTARS